MIAEPSRAFPHLPPSQSVRETYAPIFQAQVPVDRWSKDLTDRILCVVALLVAAPLFLAIVAAHFVLSAVIESERGPLFISYRAVSRGVVFRKLKFRVIRHACIDARSAAAGDWHAYSAEWDTQSLTLLGQFLKKCYLDELPQLINIALGQMSFVGPRPLAVHHYQRDLEQGNVHRKLLKAGLLGPSQSLKGKARYGSQDEEYRYCQAVLRSPAPVLLFYDLKLIGLGILRVLEAKGL